MYEIVCFPKSCFAKVLINHLTMYVSAKGPKSFCIPVQKKEQQIFVFLKQSWNVFSVH
jgi:hypothetical protein